MGTRAADSKALAGAGRIAAGLLLLSVAGCARPDRQGAAKLTESGVAASTALQKELDARVIRLRKQALLNDFNNAYSVFRFCKRDGAPAITLADGADPNCDVLAFANARKAAPVNALFARLTEVMRLRRRAVAALGTAYQAFGEEAAYDASGDMEAALEPAVAAANTLGAALGLGPVAGVIGAGLKAAGGGLADSAQRKRLLEGSRALLAVTRHVRQSLEAEVLLHEELDGALDKLDTQTRTNLLRAGLLFAGPTVREIGARAGLPMSTAAAVDAMVAADAPLRGAAQAAALAAIPEDRTESLRAAIPVLRALEKQHAEFETNKPISAADLAATLDRLSSVLDAARE